MDRERSTREREREGRERERERERGERNAYNISCGKSEGKPPLEKS